MEEQHKKGPDPRDKKDIKTDEILERLEKGRGSGGVIKLVGRFLGNSERPEYYRLYLTEELNRYFEFPKEATIDAERLPSGRIVVWIRAGTKVVETISRNLPEDFFTGSIHGENARLAGGLLGAGRMMLQMADGGGCCGGTKLANCNSTVDTYTCSYTNCPVSTVNC